MTAAHDQLHEQVGHLTEVVGHLTKKNKEMANQAASSSQNNDVSSLIL